MMGDTTSILWNEVYDELRRIARLKLKREKPGQTLQATAIVNEVYLRLRIQGQDLDWRSRQAFFVAAAQAMQRILVDQARRKKALKRDDCRNRIAMEPNELAKRAVDLSSLDMDTVLLLDEGLAELEKVNQRSAQVVQLRFFMGLQQNEIVDTLDISQRTCDRLWAYARAWLFRYFQQQQK